MKHAILLVTALAVMAPAPSAMAQFGGSSASRRAEDACSRAAQREAEARFSSSSRPQIRDAEAQRSSNNEWDVRGSGDYAARRGEMRPFDFSCTYNSRTGATYSVAVDQGGSWGSRPPPGGGGGYYPPGRPGGPGGQPERPPATGPAKGLYLSAGQPNNTVRDTVRAGDAKSYSVEDQRGFNLNVGLRLENGGQASFDVRDPRGRLVFRGDVEGNIYRGPMQGSGGAYRIDVYGPDDRRQTGRASYYLDVALSQ